MEYFYKENGIVLITLSSHDSHKHQPLDRRVFEPFKTFYNEACESFMINNPGKSISLYDIPELISKNILRAVCNYVLFIFAAKDKS